MRRALCNRCALKTFSQNGDLADELPAPRARVSTVLLFACIRARGLAHVYRMAANLGQWLIDERIVHPRAVRRSQ